MKGLCLDYYPRLFGRGAQRHDRRVTWCLETACLGRKLPIIKWSWTVHDIASRCPNRSGDYTLDFSGEWQRDATVSIDCGFSDLNLIIPKGVNAVVTIDSALADINIGEGWSQKNNVYTQEGEGHLLTIVINMGAGDVSIGD